MIYVLLETVLYIPTLIFASDMFSKPRSYKRSMLLLFLNYIEIIFSFGVLYSCGNYLNKPFGHWFDAIYFSTINSASIGYGDFYPVTTVGKVLATAQAFLFLLFVVYIKTILFVGLLFMVFVFELKVELMLFLTLWVIYLFRRHKK